MERPDGDGGWTVVGVFGTPDTPGHGTARYLSSRTALEAAQVVLTHVWPVNLAEDNKREDPARWSDGLKANTGIAGHRITVDVDESNRWSVLSWEPVPDPLTVTVAELRLAAARAAAAELAEAKTRLQALNEQVAKARADVRHSKYRMTEAVEEAVRAGVPQTEVAEAVRPPRAPRRKPAR